MRILLASLLLFVSPIFAQSEPPAMIIKVIDLHYIQANKLIPQLTPLVASGESVGGSGYSLILKVSPDTLTQLRPVIHQLDVAPVVFNVSIRQGSNDDDSTGNDTVYSASSNAQAGNAQSVSVQNGQAAFVATGSERPVISGVSGGLFPGVSYAPQNEQQGFFIKPILQGQKVQVTIRRNRSQANATDNQASQNQNLDTTTMVPLNQWVLLGSSGQDNINPQPSSSTYSAGDSFNNQAALFIRISVVK